MGRKYALFRTSRGAVGLVGARCCHMGADLSRCGTVDGERLTCGYHAWAFDTAGVCVDAPQCERVPEAARQNALPVLEYAGNIWFWWGHRAPESFVDISYFEANTHMNLKGEVHIGRSDPLPIIEHIADIYHFPHNHRAAGAVEYVVLENSGPTLEFQLRPKTGATATRIQALFKPYALITMASPCTGIYRTQSSERFDRTSPLLTMLLGVTPVRHDLTIFTWRIAVRKVSTRWFAWPVNRALGLIMWTIIRRNVHVDLEVLKWMNPPRHTLWVKADGASVREFRRFYTRNVEHAGDVVDAGDGEPAVDGPVAIAVSAE
jgi:phenylpropionate dioxygenase-like ring-hydroxylating dioxygenase large terminal subunit